MDNKRIIFRMVTEDDAESLLKIYSPYVKNTSITFEYEVPSLEDFRRRISDISRKYPYIVCEYDGNIIGYAYAHKFHERAAYQWNVELSVYIKEKFTGYGLGRSLYKVIIDILKLQNVRNIYSYVTSPNVSSEKLHEYFNFRKIGCFTNTGYKFGRWIDVTLYEKNISEYSLNPEPVKSIQELAPSILNGILDGISEKDG